MKDWYKEDKNAKNKRRGDQKRSSVATPTQRAVMFVEQTPGGELAARLRELFLRIEPTLGFYVKVVEKVGRSLQGLFPLTTLREGMSCGRGQECITCYQGAEVLPDCTRQLVLYENVCTRCVPGAASKDQLKEEELNAGEHPVIYVGETSRSILERAKEHWAGCGKSQEDNHKFRHQSLMHSGESAKFTMRVVESLQSALSRQVSEAVRIRRRGGLGSIMNSKSEYNRCHITRLRVEEE